MADEVVISSLGDFCAAPGMPSEPTLRKLIRDHPDFPVILTGKNGSAYEIDVRAAVAWLKAREEKEREALRARGEEVRQVVLDLLGEDAAAASAQPGMSALERKQALEEELIAIKVRERRRELIRRDSVEQALAQVLVMFRQRGETFSARLGKRTDLSREQIAAIDELMRQDQDFLADRMEKIAEITDADAAPGADPAV